MTEDQENLTPRRVKELVDYAFASTNRTDHFSMYTYWYEKGVQTGWNEHKTKFDDLSAAYRTELDKLSARIYDLRIENRRLLALNKSMEKQLVVPDIKPTN